MHQFLEFLRNEDASAAIETGLLTSLIGVVSITALSDLGKQIAAIFRHITAVLSATTGGIY
jgi:Flp pilus assembly pilin Flp